MWEIQAAMHKEFLQCGSETVAGCALPPGWQAVLLGPLGCALLLSCAQLLLCSPQASGSQEAMGKGCKSEMAPFL